VWGTAKATATTVTTSKENTAGTEKGEKNEGFFASLRMTAQGYNSGNGNDNDNGNRQRL
jgi:hypothetical protein